MYILVFFIEASWSSRMIAASGDYLNALQVFQLWQVPGYAVVNVLELLLTHIFSVQIPAEPKYFCVRHLSFDGTLNRHFEYRRIGGVDGITNTVCVAFLEARACHRYF